MDFSEKLSQILRSHSAIAALVQDRVFPVLGPRELNAPCLLYAIVGGEDLGITHDDASTTDHLDATLVQLTAYAVTRDTAVILIRHARAALRAAQQAGTFAVNTTSATRETYEGEPGQRLYRAELDITIMHTLAV